MVQIEIIEFLYRICLFRNRGSRTSFRSSFIFSVAIQLMFSLYVLVLPLFIVFQSKNGSHWNYRWKEYPRVWESGTKDLVINETLSGFANIGNQDLKTYQG